MKRSYKDVTLGSGNTRITVPIQAVKDLHLNTGDWFLAWTEHDNALIGTLTDTPAYNTTKIMVQSRGRQFRLTILEFFVQKFRILPTNDGGERALFAWDEHSLTVSLPVVFK